MRQASIDHPHQRTRMIAGISRRTPNARYAKFAAAAVGFVIGAVNFSPSVTATPLDSPTIRLGIAKRRFNILLRVNCSTHCLSPVWTRLRLVVNRQPRAAKRENDRWGGVLEFERGPENAAPTCVHAAQITGKKRLWRTRRTTLAIRPNRATAPMVFRRFS